MPIIRFKMTLRNTLAQDIVDRLNAGTGAAKLKLYTGALRATPDTALSGETLLGTLICSDPCAAVASGVITFAAITQDNAADASGTAGWCTLTDSDDVSVIDLDVTNEAGSGAVKLNTTTIVAGGPILMSSLAITVGA